MVSQDGVLKGYRVLDLADEKGLLCGKILAELGADVIKVERPGGDPARNIGPFYHDNPSPETSLFWFAFNASKRGITLDIESSDGKNLLLDLVKKADFLIESFDPGYMARLGLDYACLKEINPGLIYVSITGFGQSGPYSCFKAPDIVVWAMSGVMNFTGDPGRPPLSISVPQSYLHAGGEGAVGALIALWHRETAGEGQYVDVSAQESLLRETLEGQHYWDISRINPQRQGPNKFWGHSLYPWLYRCKDGWVCFLTYVSSDMGVRSRRAMAEWMDREGMADDFIKSIDWDKLDTRALAPAEVERLGASFQRFIATRTKKELLEKSLEVGMALAPLESVEDVVNSPHYKARNFWTELAHPELGAKLLYPGAPYVSSETPYRVRGRAPLIGEHNEEIYIKELGLSGEQLVTLKVAGVI